MANSYWSYMYGGFANPKDYLPGNGAEALHGIEKEEFITEWYRIRNVLINSGYNLDKIKIVREMN